MPSSLWLRRPRWKRVWIFHLLCFLENCLQKEREVVGISHDQFLQTPAVHAQTGWSDRRKHACHLFLFLGFTLMTGGKHVLCWCFFFCFSICIAWSPGLNACWANEVRWWPEKTSLEVFNLVSLHGLTHSKSSTKQSQSSFTSKGIEELPSDPLSNNHHERERK